MEEVLGASNETDLAEEVADIVFDWLEIEVVGAWLVWA